MIATADVAAGEAVSIGWLGNAVDLLETLVGRGITPDALTDQTSAHDPLDYRPTDLTDAAAAEMRRTDPDEQRNLAADPEATEATSAIRRDLRAQVLDWQMTTSGVTKWEKDPRMDSALTATWLG